MAITSDMIPPPYPGRGVRSVRSNFADTKMFLVHNEAGVLIGEMRVPNAMATPELEQLLLDWLESADPVDLQRRPGLRLA